MIEIVNALGLAVGATGAFRTAGTLNASAAAQAAQADALAQAVQYQRTWELQNYANFPYLPARNGSPVPTYVAPVQLRCAYCKTKQSAESIHCESCGAPQ